MSESLRDKLRARERPSASHKLRMSDDTEAQQQLREAQTQLGLAQLRGDEDDSQEIVDARAKVEAAQAAVDEHYESLTVRAIAPSDMEALMDAHPPTKKDEADEQPYNVATFRPALLELCVEGGMSAEDWEQEYKDGTLSFGEYADLFNACMQINSRAPGSWLGKG